MHSSATFPCISPTCRLDTIHNRFQAVAVQNWIESPFNTQSILFSISLSSSFLLFSLHRPWHSVRSIPAIDRPQSISLRGIDHRPYNRTPSKSASAYKKVFKSIHNIHCLVAPKGSNQTAGKYTIRRAGLCFVGPTSGGWLRFLVGAASQPMLLFASPFHYWR